MVNHGLSTGGLFLIVASSTSGAHQGHRRVRRAGGGDARLRHVHPDHLLGLHGPALLNGFIADADPAGAYAANKVWAYWPSSGIVLGAAYPALLYQGVLAR